METKDDIELMLEVMDHAWDEAGSQDAKAVKAACVATGFGVFDDLINAAWEEFGQVHGDHLYWDEIAEWLQEMRETYSAEAIPLVFRDDDEEDEEDEEE